MEVNERNKLLKNYDKQYKDLMQTLILFLIDFDRKELKLSPVDHPKYIIRNSILYRFECIRFHLDLLLQIYEMIVNKCYSNFPQKDNHMLLKDGTDKIGFVFDDIVLHICSMFDYLGNLLGLLYIGRNKMKIKWNGIAKSVMDKNNKMSKTNIAEIVEKEHREWIDHLFSYRSRLIHHKRDNAGASQTINIDAQNQSFDINVFIGVPNEFVKMIKRISQDEIEKKKLNIIDIAVWISEESLTTANNLIIESKNELEPLIKKDIEEQLGKLKKEKPELFE